MCGDEFDCCKARHVDVCALDSYGKDDLIIWTAPRKKNTISLDTLGNDTKDLVCIAAKRTLLAPPCQCNVMSEVSFRTATPVSMAEDTPTPPRCTCLKIFSWTWSMVIPTLRSCQPAYMGSPPPTRWSSQKSKYKYRDHLVGDCQKYPWADRSICENWGDPWIQIF